MEQGKSEVVSRRKEGWICQRLAAAAGWTDGEERKVLGVKSRGGIYAARPE